MILNFYLSKRQLDGVPTPSRYSRKNSEYENHLKICARLQISPYRIPYHAAISKLAKELLGVIMKEKELESTTICGYLHDRRGNTNRHDISLFQAMKILDNNQKIGTVTFQQASDMECELEKKGFIKEGRRLGYTIQNAKLNFADFVNGRIK